MPNENLKCAANLAREAKVVVREPRGNDPAGRPIVEVTIGHATEIIPLTPAQACDLASGLIALEDMFEQ